MRPTLLLTLALLTALIVPHVDAEETSYTVRATDFKWTPANVTIVVGSSVGFANERGSHAWQQDGSADVCDLPCVKTFTTVGVVGYHCAFHPTMTGNVTVVPPTTITILTPTVNQTVAGTLNVTGFANNSNHSILTVRVMVDGGAFSLATRTNGTDIDWWHTIDTLPLANGVHTVEATAYASTGAAGRATAAFVVDNPKTLDIVADHMVATAPITGSPTLTVFAINPGNTHTGPFHVKFEYLTNGAWRELGGTTFAGIAAHQTVTIHHTWTGGAHLGKFPVRATLDDTLLVTEASETNNVVEGTATWHTPLVSGVDPLG